MESPIGHLCQPIQSLFDYLNLVISNEFNQVEHLTLPMQQYILQHIRHSSTMKLLKTSILSVSTTRLYVVTDWLQTTKSLQQKLCREIQHHAEDFKTIPLLS